MIDAEHMRRAHVPAGFFERLANGTFNQGFAALPVTGRLVEQGRAVDALLDDQEAAVAFDNAGDDDMWHAAVAHGSLPSRRRWQRSAERRVGKECVSPWRARGSLYQ